FALAPVLVALAPAAFKLWQGRSLARLIDDPALPERLLAAQRVRGGTIGAAFCLLVVAWPRHAAWTLPLLAVSHLAAGFPLRRRLYDETWTLAGYLAFFLRLWVAVFGFWIVLGSAPALVASAPFDWLVAALLTIVLAAWNLRYAAIFRRIMRAQPIDNPALLARFERMSASCGVPAVRFGRVGLPGGKFPTAAALPALGEPGVLSSAPLLEALDEDGAAAICAHEIAPLEHYPSRRLRRITAVNLTLIALGAALTPAVRLLMP